MPRRGLPFRFDALGNRVAVGPYKCGEGDPIIGVAHTAPATMQIEHLLLIDAPAQSGYTPNERGGPFEFEQALVGAEGGGLAPPGAPPPGTDGRPQVEEAPLAEPIAQGPQLDFPLLDLTPFLVLFAGSGEPTGDSTQPTKAPSSDSGTSDSEAALVDLSRLVAMAPFWMWPLAPDAVQSVSSWEQSPLAAIANLGTASAPSGRQSPSPVATWATDFASAAIQPSISWGHGPETERPTTQGTSRLGDGAAALSQKQPLDGLTMVASGPRQAPETPILERVAVEALNPTAVTTTAPAPGPSGISWTAQDSAILHQTTLQAAANAEPNRQDGRSVLPNLEAPAASGNAGATAGEPKTQAPEPRPAQGLGPQLAEWVERPEEAGEASLDAPRVETALTEAPEALTSVAVPDEIEPTSDKDLPDDPISFVPTASTSAQAPRSGEPRDLAPRLPARAEEEIRQAVAERIESLAATRKGGTVRIRLEPHELGTILVTVRSSGNQVHAEIAASNDQVRAGLEASRGQLSQVVESKGITLARLDVGSQPGPDANPGDRPQYQDARQDFERHTHLRAAHSQPTPQPSMSAWTAGPSMVDYRI